MLRNLLRVISCVALLLAVASPFITLSIFRGLVSWDVQSFQYWTVCLKGASGPIFTPCSPENINYPTIGLWASAGALWGLEVLRGVAPSSAIDFQYYLGVIDAANVVLVYLLLRGLEVKGASWLTLLFAVLPSTRVGGNLWAQIDNVSQLFLSLGFLFGLWALKGVERGESRSALRYLTGLGVCIGCALLTKQLVVFSLPALAIVWIVAAMRTTRVCPIWKIALSCVIALGSTLVIDQLSPTPPGYLGLSLLYVLSTGSHHGEMISASGVTLYTLLHLPPPGSSRAAYPLFSLGSIPVTIVPFWFGLVTFVAACAASAWWIGAIARKRKGASAIEVTCGLLLFAALCNLFMNTALPGNHERYLYHYGFFIFPVLARLIQKRLVSPVLALVCLIHLTLYGYFVFSVLIGQQNMPWALEAQWRVAALNVALSIYALWALGRTARGRILTGHQ
jgi:uncharacterized membrane protein